MKTYTMLHNPRCSKSRETLAILEAAKVQFSTRNYVDNPLSVEELRELARKLGKEPAEFIRTKEAIFSELDLEEASSEELIAAMAKNPILIERPIVITNDAAVIGRPPTAVNAILPPQ